MNAKELGSFIASIRKERNMTQKDLALKIHVTTQAVSKWERGVGLPDINTLEPLAAALDIEVDELMLTQRHTTSTNDAQNNPTTAYSGTLNGCHCAYSINSNSNTYLS